MNAVATRVLVRALLLLIAGPTILAAQVDSGRLAALRYRFIGPDGNRTIAVAGVPGNPMISYIGAASGGLWKTTDGGNRWRPIFDDQGVSSIGSIAIAASDPNVIYVGTGETFVIRPAHSLGTGVYRSTDAGKTWTHVGLDRTGRIGRMVVDPRDPDVAFACALGHTHGQQPERGVYRTTDGGATWDLVLHVDDDTGCIDLAMDPTNPRILLAGFWQVHINTWGLNSGGPGGGAFLSHDGGLTWTRVAGGLPGGDHHPVGKVAVGIARTDPNRMYVLVEDSSPGFYRSDDGGTSWRLMSQNHTMAERAPYYTRFAIDPADENRIYFTSVRFSLSIDGGASLVRNPPRGGGDTHDVWIDPTDANRIMVADDGGANLSFDRGRTFRRVVPPVAQMYHVAVDDRIPYHVFGNRQDGYSYRGPSNSLSRGGIPLGAWEGVGGCESGFAQPDPADNDIVWSGCYDGGLERFDARTGHIRNVRVWPEAGYGWVPAELRYRWHWNFPIEISTHHPHRVYVGSQYVHASDDGGQSWREISPDLTLNRKDHQQSSGGIATDNLMTFDGSTLFAIEESPLETGVIWAGTNDGQVQLTRDDGATWTNVTDRIPDLPPWGTVASIFASRHDSGTAYITVDLHQMGDFDPYVYKATEYGRHWTRIDAGVPRSMLSFAHIVQEDPARAGLLYLGTDNALYVSLDDGAHWTLLRTNLPPAPVYWLTVQPRFGDLVVATYGRGFYILDDISPLRALDAGVLEAPLTFMTPRDAYRFETRPGIRSEPGAFASGRNPSYGAILNIWVGNDRVKGRAELTVLNGQGDTVRTLRPALKEGLNRVTWDLRYEGPKRAKLRTPPPDAPWVPLGSDGTRPIRSWDLDLNGGQRGPRVAPGVYTLHLRAGNLEREQRVTVLKDPTSAGTAADIEAQVAAGLEMRDELNAIVDMIDRIEWLRRELDDVQTMLADDSTAQDVVNASEELERQAIEVEGLLFDVNLTGAREDAFRSPMRLYGRLSALASDLIANGAGFGPTDQQTEVHRHFQELLDEYRARFADLINERAEAFRDLLRRRGLRSIAER